MRDLSCYLSSISLHALAVAIVTATTVFKTPDFAVTSGGVSIAGSQASVEIDTRVDFTETSPVDLVERSPAANPFQVAPPDAATAASVERKPAPPEVDAPSAPARPLAARPRAIVEPLLIPHDGLLERIGEKPERTGPSPPVAQVAPGKAPAKTEVVDPKPEPPVELASKPVQKPKLPGGKKPQKKTSPKENVKPAKQEDLARKTETAKPASKKGPAASAPPRETQKPEQEATKQSASKAAPSSNEPAGARVELPRKLATNASPTYPLDAWQKQQEGVAYLLVRVSSSGLADSVTVYRSSGFKSLDAAAEKTVRGWKFQPARRAGKPVASAVVVPVRFRIQRP